jgi:hypothetical protein
MKTKRISLGLAGILMSALVITSCQKDNNAGGNEQYASIIEVSGDGVTDVNVSNLKSAMVETPALSGDEEAGLLQMKNDEKLARDVYTLFGETQSLQIFKRIAGSETRHLQAVLTIMSLYNMADTLVDGYGVFANAAVQELYNTLTAQGSTTEGALKAGAAIEEMDIRDLTVLIGQTTNANLITVYENLQKGSRNHLRAFNRQLTNIGASYTPQYLDQATYDQIVSSPNEKGKQYKMHGKGKGKGKGNGNGKGMGNGSCQGDGSGSGQGKGEGTCNN